MVEEQKQEEQKTLPKTISFNLFITVVLIILLFGLFIGYFAGAAFKSNSADQNVAIGTQFTVLPSEQLKTKVENYLNELVKSGGLTAKLSAVEDAGMLYKIGYSIYEGNKVLQRGYIYATKDGSYVILCSVMDMNKPIEQPEPEEPAEVQKSDKPKLELFVMSFCPYGIMAEKAVKPVVDLFGNKIEVQLKFIVDVSGDTPQDIDSLHGSNEAMEDLRQICINKLYPQKFWDYLMLVDGNYSEGKVSASNINEKWHEFALPLGIDVNAVNECVNKDAVAIIKQHSADAERYGVTGSPTFIINGTKVNVNRTPEGVKQALCNAFNTPPAECSQTLSNSSGTPSGSCG